ncbi:hypothetical protein MMC25_000463, partial [Agyrium rufum]|nr:hypothetical protein [Agyrium rufum]
EVKARSRFPTRTLPNTDSLSKVNESSTTTSNRRRLSVRDQRAPAGPRPTDTALPK